MSRFTDNWTAEGIREIISHLDEVTGMKGVECPIELAGMGRVLGTYSPSENSFCFNRSFFNSPETPETAVIHVIRHEYAHYVQIKANLIRFTGDPEETFHGGDFAWVSHHLGIPALRSMNVKKYGEDSADTILRLCHADDIRDAEAWKTFAKWKAVPISAGATRDIMRDLRRENRYYEIGDVVMHPDYGFGHVTDSAIFGTVSQKVEVTFENGNRQVFFTYELYRMVDGVLICCA